jgi:hypothetical protein
MARDFLKKPWKVVKLTQVMRSKDPVIQDIVSSVASGGIKRSSIEALAGREPDSTTGKGPKLTLPQFHNATLICQTNQARCAYNALLTSL